MNPCIHSVFCALARMHNYKRQQILVKASGQKVLDELSVNFLKSTFVKYNLCTTNCIHWKCTKPCVLIGVYTVYNCEAAPQSCRAQGLLSLPDGLLQPIRLPEGPQLPTRTGALQPDHTSSYIPK